MRIDKVSIEDIGFEIIFYDIRSCPKLLLSLFLIHFVVNLVINLFNFLFWFFIHLFIIALFHFLFQLLNIIPCFFLPCIKIFRWLCNQLFNLFVFFLSKVVVYLFPFLKFFLFRNLLLYK